MVAYRKEGERGVGGERVGASVLVGVGKGRAVDTPAPLHDRPGQPSHSAV